MIDWDQDGEIEPEDVGLSLMLLDDLDREPRTAPKKGCFGGCLSTVILCFLVVFLVFSLIISL